LVSHEYNSAAHPKGRTALESVVPPSFAATPDAAASLESP
jgi:hypothetical protein